MTTRGLSPLPILAELDTQLIIAEMQGYAPYTRNEVSNHRTHGSHSQVCGGTSEVKALLTRRLAGTRRVLKKAGRSRICLSVDGKHLKADCGFGLDDSKAQMHFCTDAQMPRSVKTAIAVLTDRVPV